MDPSISMSARPETLIGALLYLMTTYQRRPRQDVAYAIASHLECLSRHASANPMLREIAAGMQREWERAADTAVLRGTSPRPDGTLLN